MSLSSFLDNGRLRRHTTSLEEISDLFRVVDRDLEDASLDQLSADRRFATAYNAALQLATIALHCAGYRTAGYAHHFITIQVLPEIMGDQLQSLPLWVPNFINIT